MFVSEYTCKLHYEVSNILINGVSKHAQVSKLHTALGCTSCCMELLDPVNSYALYDSSQPMIIYNLLMQTISCFINLCCKYMFFCLMVILYLAMEV